MKNIIFFLALLCVRYLTYAQAPLCTGEETLLAPGSYGQITCYNGIAGHMMTPWWVDCKCEWERAEIHENDVQCYPQEGLQLIFEEHFGSNTIMRKPYTTGQNSYDNQVIYRDWRPGYGYNGSIDDDPDKSSWDDDTLNINLNAGNLELSAIKRSSAKTFKNYSDHTDFITQWTGGTIMTQDKWGYGAFEIRCKMSLDAEGLNHAFWLFGGSLTGCTKEEIDIFETFDDLQNNGNLHDINPWKEQKNRRIVTTMYSSNCNTPDTRCQRFFHSKLPQSRYLYDWHTFKLFWTPYEVTLYIDGRFYYKMFSHGMALWQTNPIQQGQSCAVMSNYARVFDQLASGFPWFWPEQLIPKYHVKRMKTYPRAEVSTMNLFVQNSIRIGDGNHLNLPQTMQVDYVKVWQFGDCETDVYKSGTFFQGCAKDAPMVNYHMGKTITYGTDFVLSSANVCDSVDENKNYWNERLTSVGSEAVILEPGATIEMGTNWEAKIASCQEINAHSVLPYPGGFLRTSNSGLPGHYDGTRDTVINGQYMIYQPEEAIGFGPLNEEETAMMENGISIVPNPVSNEITVTSTFSSAQFEIIGSMGQVVMRGGLQQPKEIINISSLNNGAYWLKLQYNDQIKQLRFIKISQP